MKTPILLLSLACSTLSAYEMHEWGTFTTVSGSNGHLLTGLHVEEEHLPPFVYSHLGMRPSTSFSYPNMALSMHTRNPRQLLVARRHDNLLINSFSKGMYHADLRNVTVKMETPVIYFYGDDTPKVNVKVGFNGGTISQWYPQRLRGDSPNKISAKESTLSEEVKKSLGDRELILRAPIDFAKPYTGSIEWDVEVLPKAEADPAFTFKPNENYTWIYPRVPDANMLKVGNEYEDYLFYRGVGNFELPATFSVDSNETLHVKNNSKEAIPFAFAFENISGKFRFKTLGEIPSNKTASVKDDEWISPKKQQVEVFQQMRAGLIAQGLSSDEANGMVKTWWKSYFNKPGLRVFWVVPNYDLEKVLPLTLTPAPEKSVRVLIGRADVLRPRFEQEMVATIGTKAFQKFRNDRFFLPYKNRLEQLITQPVFTKFDEQNLSYTNLTITAKKGDSILGDSIYFNPGNDIKLQHLDLKGPWKVIGSNKLSIGDTLFTLDQDTGILTAKATQDPDYSEYHIQLHRVLN